MTTRILSMVIRLTYFAIMGVVLLLIVSHFVRFLDDLPLSAKAVAVVAFVLGRQHGWWLKQRRDRKAKRD